MKILILMMMFFSNASFAVGWEHLDIRKANEYGFVINAELEEKNNCYKVSILSPKTIDFESLGELSFFSIRYKKVLSTEEKGWELTSTGTEISLPYEIENNLMKSGYLCIASEDIDKSYISVQYYRKKAPPMFLLFPIELAVNGQQNNLM